jgi:hypothetical protein
LAYQPPASSTFLSEQISHQQPAVLFSKNKSAPATGHQPNEQAVVLFPVTFSVESLGIQFSTYPDEVIITHLPIESLFQEF